MEFINCSVVLLGVARAASYAHEVTFGANRNDAMKSKHQIWLELFETRTLAKSWDLSKLTVAENVRQPIASFLYFTGGQGGRQSEEGTDASSDCVL